MVDWTPWRTTRTCGAGGGGDRGGFDRYLTHVFADRFGDRCRVIGRGRTANSVAIEFASDGLTAVVSSRALKRVDPGGRTV